MLVANERKKCKLQRKLDLLEFKLIESHKKEERTKERRAISTIKENSRYFFTYAKSKSKVNVPIGPFEDHGNIISDPKGIGKVLQNQFKSVFSTPVYNQTELNLLTQDTYLEFSSIDILQKMISKMP